MTFTRRPIFPKHNYQFWKIKTGCTKTEFKHLFEPYHINIFVHIVVVSIIYEPALMIMFGHLLEIYGFRYKFIAFIL